MKFLLISAMVVFVAAIELHPDETHDHETLPADLENMRMRLDCLLDKGPCDEVNATYKKQILTTLETWCANCKPEAKIFMYNSWKTIKDNFPKDYQELVKRYDPEEKYIDKFLTIWTA